MGSEMCIRDRGNLFGIEYRPPAEVADAEYPFTMMTGRLIFHYHTCLLYTSDAADDLLCVDLGGRRIIQKKN